MKQIVKLDKQKDFDHVLIDSWSHDGRGIATIEGKKTFIEGALLNEIVSCRVFKKHRSYQEALLTKVESSSPLREKPACKHFGLCGGCSLQHLNTNTQLELKQKTLIDQLKHFGGVEPLKILPPLNAATTGYRRKARLGVKYVFKKEKLLVGFREKQKSYLADLDTCAILHPSVNDFSLLKELIASLDQMKTIPQVEIAIGDSKTALIFRCLEPLTLDDRNKLIQFGQTNGFHLYLQPNSPASLEKLWPQDHNHYLSYSLPDENLEYLFHPLDFTQINLELNRAMVNQAMELLELNAEENVLDLFCGIGNFSLPIAKRAKQVIGIEGSDDMVARAYLNATHNHIENCAFYKANLMDPAAFKDQSWMHSSIDKILLDPPRAGAIEVIPYLKTLAAKRIVYVSCNPATLARDAGALVSLGYTLTSVGVMNMFPHTTHVEAMAVFDR